MGATIPSGKGIRSSVNILPDVPAALPFLTVLIPFIKDPVTKERKQIHPEDIHLTAKDFEASKDNISKDEWENLHALKEIV